MRMNSMGNNPYTNASRTCLMIGIYFFGQFACYCPLTPLRLFGHCRSIRDRIGAYARIHGSFSQACFHSIGGKRLTYEVSCILRNIKPALNDNRKLCCDILLHCLIKFSEGIGSSCCYLPLKSTVCV